MRACENRFLSVSCSAKPFSLTYCLDVCELALSSLFPLAGFCICQWLCWVSWIQVLFSCALSQPHKRSCSAVGGFDDHVVLRDIMFLSVIMILSPSQSRQISYQKQHHPNNFLDLSLNKFTYLNKINSKAQREEQTVRPRWLPCSQNEGLGVLNHYSFPFLFTFY